MTTQHLTTARMAQSVALLVTMVALLGTQAGATDVVPGYPFGAFTLENSYDSDGFAAPGPGLILTGPNTGSGYPGSSVFATTIVADAILHFHYVFNSQDYPYVDDYGYFDRGGYVLDNWPTYLAYQDGESGDVNVPVLAGQKFGFVVWSGDNIGYPGVLTVTSGAPVATPEPGDFGLVLAGMLCIWSLRWRTKTQLARRS